VNAEAPKIEVNSTSGSRAVLRWGLLFGEGRLKFGKSSVFSGSLGSIARKSAFPMSL
jgi:hypothetical protein